jgi:hypothetical protein
MKRKAILLTLVVLFSSLFSLSAQRIVFSDTIPLQGHIELQEKFSLEINERNTFTLNQDVAGTTHEVASYEFYSNSPELAYTMRLSPGFSTTLGDGIFAFRNTGLIADEEATPIPFKISVLTPINDGRITNEAFQEVQKTIGIRDGSRAEERGTIYVTFPTVNEGFNLRLFTFGSYEASIAVEVLAD